MDPTLAIATVGVGVAAGGAAAVHCVGMCGPVASVACAAQPGVLPAVKYQLGRWISYGILGTLAGWAGNHFGGGRLWFGQDGDEWLAAAVSWTLAAALLFWAVRLWRRAGRASAASVSSGGTQLLIDPGRLVRKPEGRSTLSSGGVWSRIVRRPMWIGLLTGLFPCGALMAAVVLAAGTGSPWLGASLMVGFAVSSGIGLFILGAVASRLAPGLGGSWLRAGSIAVAAAALFVAARPVPALLADDDAPKSCCAADGDHHADP